MLDGHRGMYLRLIAGFEMPKDNEFGTWGYNQGHCYGIAKVIHKHLDGLHYCEWLYDCAHEIICIFYEWEILDDESFDYYETDIIDQAIFSTCRDPHNHWIFFPDYAHEAQRLMGEGLAHEQYEAEGLKAHVEQLSRDLWGIVRDEIESVDFGRKIKLLKYYE